LQAENTKKIRRKTAQEQNTNGKHAEWTIITVLKISCMDFNNYRPLEILGSFYSEDILHGFLQLSRILHT
jgi:hypothetical protein